MVGRTGVDLVMGSCCIKIKTKWTWLSIKRLLSSCDVWVRVGLIRVYEVDLDQKKAFHRSESECNGLGSTQIYLQQAHTRSWAYRWSVTKMCLLLFPNEFTHCVNNTKEMFLHLDHKKTDFSPNIAIDEDLFCYSTSTSLLVAATSPQVSMLWDHSKGGKS